MRNFVTYALHLDSGQWYSRYRDRIACPVLRYAEIGQGGDFTAPLRYDLESFPVHEFIREWPRLRWTRKIPADPKRMHRTFWGLPA